MLQMVLISKETRIEVINMATSPLLQLFIINGKGFPLCKKIYMKKNIVHNAIDVFYSKISRQKRDNNNSKQNTGIITDVQGNNYVYIVQSNLYIVALTQNVFASPAYIIELLNVVCKNLTYFCENKFTEEALLNNLVLVNEVLDEMFDYGVPQCLSLSRLKTYIQIEHNIVHVKTAGEAFTDIMENGIVQYDDVNVIVEEKINAYFNKNCNNNNNIDIIQIVGDIIIDTIPKNFAPIEIVLNDGLKIKSEVDNMKINNGNNNNSNNNNNNDFQQNGNESSSLVRNRDDNNMRNNRNNNKNIPIEHFMFHNAVNYEQFRQNRTINVMEYEGVYNVCTYRANGNSSHLPLKFYPPILTNATPYKLTLEIDIESLLPKGYSLVDVVISFSIFHNKFLDINTMTFLLGEDEFDNKFQSNYHQQSVSYDKAKQTVSWNLKKIQAGGKRTLFTTISLSKKLPINDDDDGSVSSSSFKLNEVHKSFSPIQCKFHVNNYITSPLRLSQVNINKTLFTMVNINKLYRFRSGNSYECKIGPIKNLNDALDFDRKELYGFVSRFGRTLNKKGNSH